MAKSRGKKNGPPKFVKENISGVSSELAELGIKLSDELPTYDVPIDLVEPNDWNINEMDDDTFNRLVQEMEETGMVNAIQVAPAEGGKFRIIGGEHRWHGARTLGWKTIPANILTDDRFMDEDLQKFLSVRLNVIKGDPAPEKFTKLYEQMVNRYGADQLKALFGFTSSDAWGKLTKGVTDSLKATGVVNAEFLGDLDKRAKKAQTVDGLGGILKSLFKKYGQDLRHSFMVFVYGGKSHLYIAMDDNLVAAMKAVVKKCRDQGLDINDTLVPVFKDILDKIGGTDA